MEMSNLVDAIGGLLVLGEEVGQSVIKENLRRVFWRFLDDVPQDARKMNMAFNKSMKVLNSRECRVFGAIGAVTSPNKKGPTSSDELKVSGANVHYLRPV